MQQRTSGGCGMGSVSDLSLVKCPFLSKAQIAYAPRAAPLGTLSPKIEIGPSRSNQHSVKTSADF
jgi:hypothetical protein